MHEKGTARAKRERKFLECTQKFGSEPTSWDHTSLFISICLLHRINLGKVKSKLLFPAASINVNEHHFSFYELLGIEKYASKEDIKKAYRTQAKLFHPDKADPAVKDEATERFKRIKQAYDGT